MVAWGEHRLAEDAPPPAPSTAEARPRSEFSRSLGLNLLTSVTPQPDGSQANRRPGPLEQMMAATAAEGGAQPLGPHGDEGTITIKSVLEYKGLAHRQSLSGAQPLWIAQD